MCQTSGGCLDRRGTDWAFYFRPRGSAIWTLAAAFSLPLPDEVYLGVSFGIDDGTAVGAMEVEVLRVRVAPQEEQPAKRL